MKKRKLNLKLAMAAAEGNASLCRLLIGHGAERNSPDENGITPVGHAVLNGRAKCVAEFARWAVEPNFLDLDERERPLINLAAEGGDVDTLVFVLLWIWSDPDRAEPDCANYSEALIDAALHDHPGAMRILLLAGADPIFRSSRRDGTPLEHALKSGNLPCVRLLTEALKDDRRYARALHEGSLPTVPAIGVDQWLAWEEKSRKNHTLRMRLEEFRGAVGKGKACLAKPGSWIDSEMIARYLQDDEALKF